MFRRLKDSGVASFEPIDLPRKLETKHAELLSRSSGRVQIHEEVAESSDQQSSVCSKYRDSRVSR